MKCFSKLFSATMAIVVTAGSATAADAIVPGFVKSINAEKKTFVMTDARFMNKEVTIKLGNDVVINRDEKDTKNDLKVGDHVEVCHDNGTFTWTAHYILVRVGDNKHCVLMHGAVKTADAKEVVLTDAGKDLTFATGNAKVRLNNEPSKLGDLKIGDHCLAIVEQIPDKNNNLKVLMIHRK